jgi:DNA topoisomerase IB
MPSFSRVAAAYKKKKKVKTQEGTEMIVYEYSDHHNRKKEKEKAGRVEKLRRKLPELRAGYRAALNSEDASERLTALAVGLIDATYERVGNDASAKEGHFGVTGWQKKHLSFSGGKAKLQYTGKSGVEQEKEISDKKLVEALKAAVKGKKPGDQILCNGEGCRVTSAKVNAFLKNFEVTAKDLRGLHANEEVKSRLQKIRKKGPKLPSDKKEKEKVLKAEFKEALEGAAGAVGHAPSMLRGSYLVPGLEERFLATGSVGKSLKNGSDEETYHLWKLLDDIDTAGDMAKGNDGWYRSRVEEVQKKRWDHVPEERVEELYGLFYPSEKRVAMRWARVNLPKGEWVEIDSSSLDPLEQDKVWDLYSLSYGSIGTHIPSMGSFLAKYKVLRLIDVDGDQDIDAFLGYKRTRHGNKLAIVGTDGTRGAKAAAIRHMIQLSKTSGWYGEASHKVEQVLKSGGVPQVTDEALVADILQGKDIVFVGGGRYKRQLPGIGWVEKAIYGKPRGAKSATKTRNEKEDEAAEDLIKTSPKKKPPRTDLRKRRVKEEEGSEDPDKKQDKKDRSQNYKDASSGRVAWRFLQTAASSALVSVRRKEDGKVVQVSEDTLREDSAAYEEVEESPKPSGEEDGGGGDEDGEKGPEKQRKVLLDRYQALGLKKTEIEEITNEVEGPEDAQAAEDLLKERAQKVQVEKEFESLSKNLETKIFESLQGLGSDDRRGFMEDYAVEKKILAQRPPNEEALLKNIKADRKKIENPDANPRARGQALARIEYHDKILANPMVDPDDPLPDSGHPLEGADLAKAQEKSLERARQTVTEYRERSSEDRAQHMGDLDKEIEGLAEGDPRRIQLEATRRGIGVASVLEDGDKATGVGSSIATLIKAAQKTGSLDKILSVGFMGGGAAGAGGDQALIREVYEDLEPEEFMSVIPEDSPGRQMAEFLASTESDNLSDEDRALMKQILVDTMVAETSFLDPAVTREIGPGATVAKHRGEAKKSRAKAIPKREMPEMSRVSEATSWLKDFLKNLSKASNSGGKRALQLEDWDFAPWP